MVTQMSIQEVDANSMHFNGAATDNGPPTPRLKACLCHGCFDPIELKHDTQEIYFGRWKASGTTFHLRHLNRVRVLQPVGLWSLNEEAGFHCVVPIAEVKLEEEKEWEVDSRDRDVFGTLVETL